MFRINNLTIDICLDILLRHTKMVNHRSQSVTLAMIIYMELIIHKIKITRQIEIVRR